jgi:hypothetical protein
MGYETIDGQDAIQVDPVLIQKLVQETFYPAPGVSSSASPRAASTTAAAKTAKTDAAKTTVDVYNGGSTPGLAGQVSAALVKDGYKAGQIANTSALSTTEVLYGTGSAASASHIASLFGVSATASSTVAAGHVQVMLGTNATVPGASATPTASSSAVPIPTTGAQGGAVTAKNGIPCVG